MATKKTVESRQINLTKTQRQLLLLLSKNLFDASVDVSVNDDILQEAKLQAVDSLISNASYQTIAKNIKVAMAHADLTAVLQGLPFVTIKGYASASYYPQPALRVMGDVDFYLAPSDYATAVQRLEENAYIACGKEHKRHETFSKNKIICELHSEIKGIPNGKDGIKTASVAMEQKVRAYLADVIDTARTLNTPFGQIIVPDDFHHGLIMLLHVAGHMLNDAGIGLRHLCDWAVYVNKVDIVEYRDKLQNIGLWTFARQLTAVCSRYLGLREMPWAGEWAEDFLAQLITDIVEAGNFGIKEYGRSTASALNKENNLLSSFASMTKQRYPFCEQYAVLLPVAMLMNLVRYLILILKGKRKLINAEELKAGKRRSALYKQFKLFQTI